MDCCVIVEMVVCDVYVLMCLLVAYIDYVLKNNTDVCMIHRTADYSRFYIYVSLLRERLVIQIYILGMKIILQLVNVPTKEKMVPLGQKRKRGQRAVDQRVIHSNFSTYMFRYKRTVYSYIT